MASRLARLNRHWGYQDIFCGRQFGRRTSPVSVLSQQANSWLLRLPRKGRTVSLVVSVAVLERRADAAHTML